MAKEARKSPSKLRRKFTTKFAKNFANFTLVIAGAYNCQRSRCLTTLPGLLLCSPAPSEVGPAHTRIPCRWQSLPEVLLGILYFSHPYFFTELILETSSQTDPLVCPARRAKPEDYGKITNSSRGPSCNKISHFFRS